MNQIVHKIEIEILKKTATIENSISFFIVFFSFSC